MNKLEPVCRFFNRMVVIILWFWGLLCWSSTPLIALEIEIYEVGQGNCVALKHLSKVVLLDGGSNESNYQAFYKLASSLDEKIFTVGEPDVPRPAMGATAASFDGSVSMKFASGGSSPESVNSRKSDGAYGASEDAPVEDAKDTLLETIRGFIGEDNVREIIIVVSHPDSDHFNLLPKIFPVGNPAKKSRLKDSVLQKVQGLILGGFAKDYAGENKEWFDGIKEFMGINSKAPIYTGMHDGSGRYPLEEVTPWRVVSSSDRPLSARPFCSSMEDKTETEKRIENLLSFSEDRTVSVDILAMNAGHTLMNNGPQSLVTLTNKNPNSNSLVLRIREEKSIVTPGDADYATWNFVQANLQLFPLWKEYRVTTIC